MPLMMDCRPMLMWSWQMVRNAEPTVTLYQPRGLLVLDEMKTTNRHRGTIGN